MVEGSQAGDFSIVRQRLRKNKLRGAVQVLAKGTGPDISPDGRLLVYAGSDPVDFSREIFVLDLTQAAAVPKQITFGDFKFLNSGPKFSPSSGRLKPVAIWFARTKILEDKVEHVVVRWSSNPQPLTLRRVADGLGGEDEYEDEYEDGEDPEEGSG